MEFKYCPKCKQTLPVKDFYPHKSHSDGLSSSCRECIKAYNHKRYHKVHKHDRKYKQRVRAYQKTWYEENRDRLRAQRQKNHRKKREKAIAAYGGSCQCCGETRFEFLALDHVNGGGNKHRQKVGNKIARWLVREGFPEDAEIRVLCHNCNSALAFYGYCPHTTTE